VTIKPFIIKKSAVILPEASPTLTNQGELAYNSTADVLNIRNSAVTDIVLQVAKAQAVSNKSLDNTNTITVLDNNFTIQDNSDNTKQLRFEASAISTGTTRTLTVPNANTTIVGTDTAQNITNKTLLQVDNLELDGNTIASTNTNGNINLDPNGTGLVVSDARIVVPTGSSGGIDVPAAGSLSIGATVGANNITLGASNSTVVIPGNLTVQGDTTTLNVATLDVEDNNITLNKGGTNATAADAGLSVEGTGGSTLARVLYDSALASRFKLGPNGSESQVITSSATQSMSNKTFSDAVTLAEISTPTTPSSGFGRIYFKSDGFLYQLNDDGSESKVGAGSGGINYISNPDADSNLTGWNTYKDAASEVPVDGTGGTAAITLTRNTTTPLRKTADFLFSKGTSNLRGEGVSTDFTIDLADRAKVIRVSFDYKTSTNYQDGFVRVYVYDVTNASVIELSQRDLMASDFGTYIGEFQSNSNSSSYRLIFHVATNTTTSWTINYDNVIVGPREIARGSVVEDEKFLGTITFTGTGTNPTKGTTSVDTISVRKVGEYAYFRVNYRHTTAGTAGSGSYLINLPSGYTINTDKVQLGGTTDFFGSQLGTGFIGDLLSDEVVVVIAPVSSTTVKLMMETPGTVWNSGSGINFADTNLFVKAEFAVPIQGWSSNSVISSDFGGRVIAARYYKTSGSGSVPSGDTVLDFNLSDYDTVAAVTTGASWKYTARESGYYKISARYPASSSGSGTLIIRLRKNGTVFSTGTYPVSAATSNVVVSVDSEIYLNAGDYIDAVSASVGTWTFGSGSSSDYQIVIHKIQSPQTLMGGELVAARYTSAAGNSLPNASGRFLDFPTKQYDTHNAVVGAGGGNQAIYTNTWRYIVPVSGYYRVEALLTVGVGFSTAYSVFPVIYVNGIEFARGVRACATTAAGQETIGVLVSSGLYANVGDVISVLGYQASGASKNMEPLEASNYVSIMKVN